MSDLLTTDILLSIIILSIFAIVVYLYKVTIDLKFLKKDLKKILFQENLKQK